MHWNCIRKLQPICAGTEDLCDLERSDPLLHKLTTSPFYIHEFQQMGVQEHFISYLIEDGVAWSLA
jgi:hypothetical protein